MKLPKDRFRGRQNQIYDDIAFDNDLTREDVFFKDCDCDGKGRTAEQRKAARSAENAPQDDRSFAQRHPYVTTGIIVGGVAITWWAGGSGGLAPGAGLASLFGLTAAMQ